MPWALQHYESALLTTLCQQCPAIRSVLVASSRQCLLNAGLGGPAARRVIRSGPTARTWAIARQLAWAIGGWVTQLDDQDTAGAHARATSPAIRALQLVADIGSWHAGLP